jgi:hypothetical protein
MSGNDALTAAAVSYACKIIFTNEGAYGSVNKNDNGALSIGEMQWHAGRALSLLKTIVSDAASQAKTILGDALYNEIATAASGAWNKRVLTADEASAVSKLLSGPQGKAAQDALASSDVKGYVLKGEGCGLKDCGALIYYADFANQYGTAASLLKQVTEQALEGAGDATAMFNATKELTTNYLARREKVYNAILALNLNADAEATADNAVADGIIGDKAYWLSVMLGATVPSAENIKKLLDNIHMKLAGDI